MSDWWEQAACRQVDPEVFFPSRGESTAQAKAVCAGCPVVEECLAYGMSEHFGIWGGKSERERRRMARNGGPVTVTCHWCGGRFVPGDVRRRYCGPECVLAARRAR